MPARDWSSVASRVGSATYTTERTYVTAMLRRGNLGLVPSILIRTQLSTTSKTRRFTHDLKCSEHHTTLHCMFDYETTLAPRLRDIAGFYRMLSDWHQTNGLDSGSCMIYTPSRAHITMLGSRRLNLLRRHLPQHTRLRHIPRGHSSNGLGHSTENWCSGMPPVRDVYTDVSAFHKSRA